MTFGYDDWKIQTGFRWYRVLGVRMNVLEGDC